ncbi:MAG: O-antigen ligase family protein [Clostridia bacterium]
MKKVKENVNKVELVAAKIVVIAVGLIIFLLSLTRGGYYRQENVVANFCITALGVCYVSYMIFKNVKSKTKFQMIDILDLLVVALTFATSLPILFGKCVAKGAAFAGIERYMSFAIIYFIIKEVIKVSAFANKEAGRYKINNILSFIIAISSMVVCFFGIDQLAGQTFEGFLSIFNIDYTTEFVTRLSSVFQYANVASMFIAIGLFTTIYLIYISKNKVLKTFLISAAYVEYLSILMTQSRMCIVFTSIVLILLMICLKKAEERNIGIISVIALMIYSAIFYAVIYNFIKLEAVNEIWIVTIVSIIPVSLIAFFSIKVLVYFTEELKNKKIFIYTLLGILAISAGIIVFTFSQTKSIVVTDGLVRKTSVNSNKDITLDISMKNVDSENSANITVEIFNKGYESLQKKVYEFNTKEKASVKEDLKKHKNAKYITFTVADVKGKPILDKINVQNAKLPLDYKFISYDIAQKINEIFEGSSSIDYRFMYMKDGISLWNTSKIVGIGNDGFRNAYQSVQSRMYISSEVHSYPVDILVNYGAIGFTAYVLIVCVAGYALVKKYIDEKDKNNAFKYINLLAILVLLVVHSMFDLDFSYSIILYLFAILLAQVPEVSICKIQGFKVSTAVVCIICTVSVGGMFLSNAKYLIAYSIADNLKTKTITEENAKERISLYEKTVVFAPTDYDYRAKLSEQYSTYMAILSKTILDTNEVKKADAVKEVKRVIPLIKDNLIKINEQNPYNKYAIQKVAANYFKNFINFTKAEGKASYTEELNYAVDLAIKIVDVGPINDTNYSFSAETLDGMYVNLEKLNMGENSKDKLIAMDKIKKELKGFPSKIENNFSKKGQKRSINDMPSILEIVNKYN